MRAAHGLLHHARNSLTVCSQSHDMSQTLEAPAAPAQNLPAEPTTTPGQPAALPLICCFAGTIFLSAFLLFQVQPLLSKFILPWFGGTPAVWTAAMLFFQLVLFGGYLYAHLLSNWCTASQRLIIHVSLLALAAANVAWGQLTPPEWLRPQGIAGENPLLQVMALLGVTVGFPYFALSATGPLLQRWFHDAVPGNSPYRLFALSNLGSLIALVSYPFFFEVYWGVGAQAFLWSMAYLVFAGGCAYCAFRTWQIAHRRWQLKKEAAVTSAPHSELPEQPSLYPRITYWLGLSTLASVMFLAVTNEVCQNVASVPLLWVVPLSLYLLSFIVAFDHPRWYSRYGFAAGVLLLVALLTFYDPALDLIDLAVNGLLGLKGDQEIALENLWWLEAGCYFLTLFLIATMCHGELARSRPVAEQLTAFYLTMSLGGALGGILVNLAAPQWFCTFWELPLGLTLTVFTAAALIWLAVQQQPIVIRCAIGCATAGLSLFSIVGLLAEDFETEDAAYRTVDENRNFYGIVSVMHRAIGDPEENYTFFSGHIQHGKQLADPAKRKTPLTYYGEGSGCEAAIQYVQARQPGTPGDKRGSRIGVIGLGVGTIATYAREKDSIRLYEINPEVIRIAQDTRWFHFLSDCPCKPEVVLGDARMQLERELRETGSQQFDILVVDAFSGDSVPTHLLTREAFDVYLKHLKPDGLLVLHITNTHLDLYPVVSKLAAHFQMNQRRIYVPEDMDRMLYRNYYFIASRDQSFLAAIPDQIEELPEYLRRERTVPMWTDEYTNLTSLLR